MTPGLYAISSLRCLPDYPTPRQCGGTRASSSCAPSHMTFIFQASPRACKGIATTFKKYPNKPHQPAPAPQSSTSLQILTGAWSHKHIKIFRRVSFSPSSASVISNDARASNPGLSSLSTICDNSPCSSSSEYKEWMTTRRHSAPTQLEPRLGAIQSLRSHLCKGKPLLVCPFISESSRSTNITKLQMLP